MQFPGAPEVHHAGERNHVSHFALVGGKAQRKLTARRVSHDQTSLPIKSVWFLDVRQMMVRADDVLNTSWPSAAGISHAPVFDIPSSEPRLGQGGAKVPGVFQVVAGAPKSAVNERDHRVWTFA